MWKETRPIWTIIRYLSVAVILVVGGALIWLFVSNTSAQPAVSTAVVLPTDTRAIHQLFIPPTAWETPTPRPKQPTWTPFGTLPGDLDLTSTPTVSAAPTVLLLLTPTPSQFVTSTPTLKGTWTLTKTNPARSTSTRTYPAIIIPTDTVPPAPTITPPPPTVTPTPTPSMTPIPTNPSTFTMTFSPPTDTSAPPTDTSAPPTDTSAPLPTDTTSSP